MPKFIFLFTCFMCCAFVHPAIAQKKQSKSKKATSTFIQGHPDYQKYKILAPFVKKAGIKFCTEYLLSDSFDKKQVAIPLTITYYDNSGFPAKKAKVTINKSKGNTEIHVDEWYKFDEYGRIILFAYKWKNGDSIARVFNYKNGTVLEKISNKDMQAKNYVNDGKIFATVLMFKDTLAHKEKFRDSSFYTYNSNGLVNTVYYSIITSGVAMPDTNMVKYTYNKQNQIIVDQETGSNNNFEEHIKYNKSGLPEYNSALGTQKIITVTDPGPDSPTLYLKKYVYTK